MTDGRVDCDVLVVGSGAGGLAAAITARHAGLDVLVVEKAPLIGGTTALSGGVLWIPGNPLASALGIFDDRADALRYMRHEAGVYFDPDRVAAFLDNGPEMVRFFEAHTHVRFEAAAKFPDYHSDAPGASQGGRSLRVLPYDGRALGARLGQLRGPLAETTIFGTMTVAGNELNHFYQTSRSLRSCWYATQLVLRHAADTVRHGRSMRLTNGHALAARLATTAFERGVPIWLSASAVALSTQAGRVTGAVIERAGRRFDVGARRGVVLACGGFPHDVKRRRAMFAHAPTGAEHWSPAPESNSGDGIRLGLEAGAAPGGELGNAAAWVPVSRVPRPSGPAGLFPHFFDRGKPGFIAVTSAGQRFANESGSYHDMMQALLVACAGAANVKAFLVCDAQAMRRFGLGHVKPAPFPIGPHVRSGYLRCGRTLAELAVVAGIDASGLQETVARYNADVADGHDPLFGKGGTAYNRAMGDPLHGPNPCLAPLTMGPFYAVEIVFGDLGTFAGLSTNGKTEVLNKEGVPIPGLHAVGNDMHSVMGGSYPGAGITLGPAMTFGFVAGRRLAM